MFIDNRIYNTYFNNLEYTEDDYRDAYELFEAYQHSMKEDMENIPFEVWRVRDEVSKYIERRGSENFQKLYKKYSSSFGVYQFYELILNYLEKQMVIDEIQSEEFTNLFDVLIKRRDINIW